jgi:hypothetical protein
VGFNASPQIGIGGHIPFLWMNWLCASGHVSYQYVNYEFQNAPTNTYRQIESHTIVVQAGPEFGVPVLLDGANDRMFKIFSYAHIIIGKDFIVQNAPKNWLNDEPYWGWAWGGGARYAFGRFSISTGVRNAYWLWRPTYDPAEGNSDANHLRVRFDEFLSPFATFELGLY